MNLQNFVIIFGSGTKARMKLVIWTRLGISKQTGILTNSSIFMLKEDFEEIIVRS